MRPIDADKLLRKYEWLNWYSISNKGGLMKGATTEDNPLIHYYDGEELIKNAPTLDVVPTVTLKKPIKQKSSSTLHSMTKAELIEYIRCLEQNYNAAVWFNENQARYIEQLGLGKKEQEVN